jgi:ribosome biogenesis GTPase A
MQNNQDIKSYLESLNTCKHIAQEEYKSVQTYFDQCDKTIEILKAELNSVIKQGSQTLSKDKMVDDGLSNMLFDLEKDYSKLLEKRNSNLAKQKRSLDYFNVMLFGRTMAGKSTIREAITCGSGDTIGKGAQRTTRDIRKYEWNNLRIIDTPGFGAYNGEEDTLIAHEVLEQSDVVLLMLNSDSIQESTFSELEYVQKLNKPLIFVMNMKKGLENEGIRRRALKNPEKYIYKEGDIQDHTERLQNLAERAGMRPNMIRIIRIHAQAAFLATKLHGEESTQLHELSHIDELLGALQDEVETNGPVRRIQTFLDSSLYHIDQQESLISDQKIRISSLLEQYKSSFKKIDQWKNKTLRDAPRLLFQEVDEAFKPLLISVADFVDDHIESDNASSAWEKHFKGFNIGKKIEKSTQSLAEQINEELNEFHHEMNEGLDISNSFDLKHNGNRFSEFDYKRINGWGSALASVVSSIAFFNAWNPIGWVAAGIGVAFAIFSFFSDNRTKKINEAKAKQRLSLTSDIGKNKDQIKKNLGSWFENEIHRAVILPIENNLMQLCVSLSFFVSELKSAENQLTLLEHDINSRLLNRVSKVLSKQHFSLPKINKIVRVPGYACYFLISEYFRNTELLKEMGKAMRETILVVYDDSLERKINHLYRGIIERIEITAPDKATIYVKKSNMSNIYGKDHRRIKLVAGICSCEITPIAI